MTDSNHYGWSIGTREGKSSGYRAFAAQLRAKDAMTLREAADAGILGGMSLDAVRKRVQRRGLRPVGRDGITYLYSVADLKAELEPTPLPAGCEDEEWKRVPETAMVEVSTEGRVWSHRRGRLLALTPQNKGYLVVRYYGDAGERVTRAVGPLVLEVHVGPRPMDRKGKPMECCHGPGGKTDNSLRNVRWDTAEANRRDRYGERRILPPLAITLRNAFLRARRRYSE